MDQAVVVTGVSTGIGRAIAQELAGGGFHVFGSVRKRADAEDLEHSLGGEFTALVFDVTKRDQIDAAAGQVREALGEKHLAGLVNNAGIAVAGPLMYLPVEEFRQQLEVNLVGVLQVSQAFLPHLGAGRTQGGSAGRIVNISSVSGKFASPFLGPYAASKFGLEAMSDSLRRELMIYGVDVIVVEPGRIRTPIWEKIADPARYADTDYEAVLKKLIERIEARIASALPPEKVAGAVRKALTAKKPRTRYPLPDQWLAGWVLPRFLPDRWMDAMIAKALYRS